MSYVQYKGKRFNVINNTLNLNDQQIESIKNIERLDRITDLQNLFLRNNKISKIEGLDHLTNLKQLDLGFNDIEDITGLHNLTQLESLDLHSNNVSKIKGLYNLRFLRFLYLSANYITEIEGLELLSRLEKLFLMENGILEIKGLDNLVNLQELNLVYNKIEKIKGVDNLKKLKRLDLMENDISKIENLSHLKQLKTLSLTRNKITAIGPVFKLLGLDLLSLKDNPIQDKRHKYLAELTINFQSFRYFSNLPFYKDLDFDNLPEEIANIREELETVEDAELINIGTHLEDSVLKEKQNFVFFNKRVIPETLAKKDTSKIGLIFHLIQMHSLKGIKPVAVDNIGHFFYFIKHFWDNDHIENEKVLVYREREENVKRKIEEMITLSLKFNSVSPYDIKPNVIIFPENSIPYKSIDYLKEISQKYKIIIIGGLEHHKEEFDTYTNKAFIIDNGKIGWQIKQTPVRISKKDIIENIECVKNPQIKIFQTSIGKLSIFICKDFLRLHGIIPFWASEYNIDYVVVLSFTNKILPFQSKILSILDSPDCKNLKLLYVSMGEYGGSDLFSIKEKQRIENSFRLNQRDNVGEKIVSRRILQEIESVVSVEEFLDYLFTKQPHIVDIQGIDVLTTATGAEILKDIKEYMQNQGFILGMQKEEDFEDY